MKKPLYSLGLGTLALMIFSWLFLSTSSLLAQESSQSEEDYFAMLRREVARVILRHPREADSVKYFAYSFQISYSDSIEIWFSEETPKSILDKYEVFNPEESLRKFMEEKGIQFDSEKIVLYTILNIWDDKKEREDNLSVVFEKMYDQGWNFPSSKEVRVEVPIVTYLKGIRT